MKIMIGIPKEFESDFSVNRFSDCFNRCLWDLKEYSCLVGNYERETLEMLMEAFKNSTPLPENHGRILDEKDIEVLDKIRAEIKAKTEEEEFARSVFRHEEKDTAKAEQCAGSITAYNNVIKLIDKYKAESEVRNERSNT